MKLHGAGDDAVMVPIVPLMWLARVVMIRADKMLFEGFEGSGTPDDKRRQEWTVHVMAEQPEDIARQSHRPPS